jgi:uncharacterized repeat protein (TIGR03803 family)
MKKIALAFSIILCLAVGSANAQYTVLYSFNGTQGAYPEGTLTLAGGKLYGTASTGGANDSGCIFSIDTNGTNYKDIYDFGATAISPGTPEGGSLKIAGARIYGVTTFGGAGDSGCVYSIDTNGTGFRDLLDFNVTNGANPYGSIVLDGAKLFGMTFDGNAVYESGNVYTIDTLGNNYKDLHDFTGTEGGNPYGDVTVIGGQLFGLTDDGANSVGNIFSMDTNGTNYIDRFDFNTSNGEYSNNLLTLSGTQFFGVNYEGGANGDGNVFSIDTAGTAFKDLLDFDGATSPYGMYTDGDVILYNDSILYGMTYIGGGGDSGTIYSVDTNGNNYTEMHDFEGASFDGSLPVSDLLPVGNYLYGMTLAGGQDTYGTIFKIRVGTTTTTGINTVKNQVSMKVYPNPGKGLFNIQTVGTASAATVNVFNVLGEQVLTTNISGPTNQIDLSNQPSGVYLYRVITIDGTLVGEGKLVIQK